MIGVSDAIPIGTDLEVKETARNARFFGGYGFGGYGFGGGFGFGGYRALVLDLEVIGD